MRDSVKVLLCFGLVIAGLLVVPQIAYGQCMVTSTNVGTTGGFPYVVKTLSLSTFCQATSSFNATCTPGGGGASNLFLSATASGPNPSCQWNCGCGTVRIDGTDGLPVELLEFEVDGGETLDKEPGATENKDAKLSQVERRARLPKAITSPKER